MLFVVSAKIARLRHDLNLAEMSLNLIPKVPSEAATGSSRSSILKVLKRGVPYETC